VPLILITDADILSYHPHISIVLCSCESYSKKTCLPSPPKVGSVLISTGVPQEIAKLPPVLVPEGVPTTT
jgi:hypothetical protein